MKEKELVFRGLAVNMVANTSKERARKDAAAPGNDEVHVAEIVNYSRV